MKLILCFLKWILIVIGILFILIIAFLFCLSKKPFVPTNYTKKVKTGGPIEEKYMQYGPHETAVYTTEAPEDWGSYIIHYPKDMQETYPAVVFVNGTGVKASKYPALFAHLASWGFFVIGNEDPSTFSGDSANASLQYLLQQNEDKDSIFYHKVDTKHIGISGHSQGGVGVFNALQDETYKHLYTCAVSLSPTDMAVAEAIHIHYDPQGITTPVMIIAAEEHDVITPEGVETVRTMLAGPHVSAIRKDADHGKMLYEGDGYVTAWLMYWLKEDQEAGNAFVEMKNNALWMDVQVNVD